MITSILIVIISVVIIVLTITKPQVTYLLGMIIIYRFFVDYYMHLPGFFKSFDVGFILCMLSGFFMWYKYYRNYSRIFIGSSTILVLGLFILILWQIIFTVIYFDQDLALTIRSARFYLFVLLYFPSFLFFLTYRKLEKVFKYVLIITIIGVILYAVQRIYPNSLLQISKNRMYYTTIGDYQVARFTPLLSGFTNISACILLYYMLNLNTKLDTKSKLIFVLLISQPLLSYARTYTLSFVLMAVTVIFLSKLSVKKKIVVLANTTIAVFIFFTVLSYIKFGNPFTFQDLLYTSLVSAQHDFQYTAGTYTIRNDILYNAVKLIEQYPLFGVGFVHSESDIIYGIGDLVVTGHNGYAVLLSQFGYIGTIIFVIFFLSIFIKGVKSRNYDIPIFLKAVAATSSGLILFGFVNLLSTTDFILERSLTTLSIIMALMQISKLINLKVIQGDNIDF